MFNAFFGSLLQRLFPVHYYKFLLPCSLVNRILNFRFWVLLSNPDIDIVAYTDLNALLW